MAVIKTGSQGLQLGNVLDELLPGGLAEAWDNDLFNVQIMADEEWLNHLNYETHAVQIGFNIWLDNDERKLYYIKPNVDHELIDLGKYKLHNITLSGLCSCGEFVEVAITASIHLREQLIAWFNGSPLISEELAPHDCNHKGGTPWL